jgi:hypothetical protein
VTFRTSSQHPQEDTAPIIYNRRTSPGFWMAVDGMSTTHQSHHSA